MKSRRLLWLVAPLPTITETHEDATPVGCQGNLSQSLEEYVNSIKELAQPAGGPVRVARTVRPRLFSKPVGKHSGTNLPRCSPRTPRAPRTTPLGLDELALTFSSQKDWGSRDPLDWLFAQTQLPTAQDGQQRTDRAPAALKLL